MEVTFGGSFFSGSGSLARVTHRCSFCGVELSSGILRCDYDSVNGIVSHAALKKTPDDCDAVRYSHSGEWPQAGSGKEGNAPTVRSLGPAFL